MAPIKPIRRATLEQLVDSDRINSGEIRFSVGAVNVRTGNLVRVDNATRTIHPEHVMASGSLPPGFSAVETEGEHYWDGGLISNTPLQWVLEHGQRQDTLAFQVDLWSARGAWRASRRPRRGCYAAGPSADSDALRTGFRRKPDSIPMIADSR